MAFAKASAKRKEYPAKKVLLAGELSEAEMAAIRIAKIEATASYELDDLDEKGKLISRKPDQNS